jgi:hypothetical protein
MDGWITPKEQLERLCTSIVEDEHFEQLCEPIAKKLIKCKQQAISIKVLAKIIAEYAFESPITYWYTALERLNVLHEITLVPPLPGKIYEIFYAKCPKLGKGNKFLQLIPQEFGTLRLFEERIKSYGQTRNLKNNSLHFQFDLFLEEHLDAPLNPSQWVLTTEDNLPKTYCKSYEGQVAVVAQAAKAASVNYRAPRLKQTIIAVFLHNVATGKTLFPHRKWLSNIYTRVQEIDKRHGGYNLHFIVGDFGSKGLLVMSQFQEPNIGMAAQVTF